MENKTSDHRIGACGGDREDLGASWGLWPRFCRAEIGGDSEQERVSQWFGDEMNTTKERRYYFHTSSDDPFVALQLDIMCRIKVARTASGVELEPYSDRVSHSFCCWSNPTKRYPEYLPPDPCSGGDGGGGGDGC
eukprot:1034403-Rhodomonas_salina.1